MSCGRLDWPGIHAFWECFEMGHRVYVVVPGVVGEKCWVCFVFFSCLDFISCLLISFDLGDCPMSARSDLVDT